ncbi:MarR family transcriptional regulator [Saccharothrix sp. NRRL B-16348]|uniref:MarR family winged helix-turn-helix transcriptional regulator n=1 Tax=Saccharothrix sp. NRRL B-16348 TaxID=1415542 RepID=UPI0006ADE4C0|nr:MarR family transcriptional regulator [Saccharothrix sp. NRRL B-16348]KOX23042.1 MarR family transcriptional regulator [Saccharothrix sp. NRRL B-16348]
MRRGERKHTDPDLGVLTSRLLFAVQEELFDTLAEDGYPDLRPQHGAVLAHLDEEGTRATDLSRRSGQHKQVVGKVLDELEALGYVTRQPDPDDRRAKLVVPTERGLAQMSRSDAIVAAIERRHAERVGEDAFGEFKRLFRQVVEDQRSWRDG